MLVNVHRLPPDAPPVFEIQCLLVEAMPVADTSQAIARESLYTLGSYIGGGGAEPAFLLTRVSLGNEIIA